MKNKIILLKRNSVMLFLWGFLPWCYISGFIFIFLYRHFEGNSCKLFCAIFFIIAIYMGLKQLKNNNKFINLTTDTIYIGEQRSNKLTKFELDEIKNIAILKNKTCIFLELKDRTKFELLNFKPRPCKGEEIFFTLRANLCKFYPEITKFIYSKEVKDYINNGTIPEKVLNKDSSAKTIYSVYILIGFVFSLFPIALGAISLVWLGKELFYNIFL